MCHSGGIKIIIVTPEVMFTVPVHVSPRILFGSSEWNAPIPTTRIGAGRECVNDTTYRSPSQKTLVNHIVPSSDISLREGGACFRAYKQRSPKRDKIHLRSNVLFYRRFLTKQQPCSVCERPLSVFEFNAILPCAHIVHLSCYEEKILNKRPCAKCKETDFRKGRVFDEIVKICCCLYKYK